MAASKRPTLILIAGPNGAGKSTLFETRVSPRFKGPFINADVIQRDDLKSNDMSAAYDAAKIAAERREKCLEEGRSFATETVFSHPSKLDLVTDAKARGYRVLAFHVGVETSDLSVARVKERVKEGGHAVPNEKVRARFDRNGPLIRQAILLSDIGLVFDNSELNTWPENVLTFTRGALTFAVPNLPNWVLKIYDVDLRG